MIISHSRKFTFVHIHKAGGTSVEKALDAYLAWNDLALGSSRLGQDMNEAYRQRYGLHKHSSVADIESVCGSAYTDDYYLFTVVRHPVDRICSLYNFVASMIRNWETKHGIDPLDADFKPDPKLLRMSPMLKWPSSRAFRSSKSFSEFIRNDDLALDTAFHPQISRLMSATSGTMKGEVLRLEDGAKLVNTVKHRLGIEFELLHENKSQITQIIPERISSTDRHWLEHRFRDDLAMLGY
jgi:Sulfotransferase family